MTQQPDDGHGRQGPPQQPGPWLPPYQGPGPDGGQWVPPQGGAGAAPRTPYPPPDQGGPYPGYPPRWQQPPYGWVGPPPPPPVRAPGPGDWLAARREGDLGLVLMVVVIGAILYGVSALGILSTPLSAAEDLWCGYQSHQQHVRDGSRSLGVDEPLGFLDDEEWKRACRAAYAAWGSIR